MLKLGIDGWKVDGTDPFIIEYLAPQSSRGPITYREYADLVYGHFFNYTREQVRRVDGCASFCRAPTGIISELTFSRGLPQNGDHCLIMSRPVDSFSLIPDVASAFLAFSPHNVMFRCVRWCGNACHRAAF